jgi:hypothetical protein
MLTQPNSNLGLFKALRGRGKPYDFMACCPAHRDVNPSLHVSIKNGTTLLYCHAGCSQDAVIGALRDKGLWEQPHPRSEARAGEVVKTYDYASADGEIMHQTLRLEPKSFQQRRPAPETGGLWIWGLTAGEYMRAAPGKDWQPFKDAKFAQWPITRERKTFDAAKLVLYQLPSVLKAIAEGNVVYLAEGEKDCDNIAALGLVATTNAMGAGKWRPEYTEALCGADVVLLPHNDAPGRDHSERVTVELHGVAKRVRVLDISKHWSECRAGQDISDWLAAGGTADKFKELVEALPDWQPSGEHVPTRALTAGEFLALKLPPRRTIISPWLPEKGLAMVYSKRGIGKTLFGLTAAYGIAAGAGFLGFQIEQPRKVLYVDGEMPAQAMQERLAAVVTGFPGQPPTGEHFRILASDLSEHGLPDLGSVEGQAWLDLQIDDAEVVILDNLSVLVRSGKENEAESWVPVQGWALRHRRQGRAIVALHHAGKGGNQRGTSKREDVLDTVISLRHPADYSPDQGARFEVHFEKCRGFYGDGAQPFEARYEVRDGAALWTRTEITDAERARVVAAIKDGLSTREAAEELGMSKSRVDRLKRKAMELGELSATAAGTAFD